LPRTSDMIKSNYISKAEVRAAGGMILTIVGCTLEKVGSDDKWVLWFNEHPKGLGLNNTKIKLLEAAYGDDSDYWVNRRVRLSFDPSVMMSGQVVGGIKLTCSTLGQAPAAGHVPPQRPVNGGGHPGMRAPGHPIPMGGQNAPAGAPPPPPPQPVWDGTRWVLPQTAPPAGAEFDQATGEIHQHGQALTPQPQRPQTISERVNQGHPPAGGLGPVGSPDNEFGDDIPF
jgi:hypothetical protein